MNIQIVRFKQGTESTVANLIVDKLSRGFVLEDTDRGLTSLMKLSEIARIKVQDRTCIPVGRYIVKMTYSNRFKCFMPELMNVPGYGGIRIHKGNFIGNTDGCPLPGQNWDADKNGYLRVWNSGKVVDPLINDIQHAINRNETVWCEVTRLYKIQV